MSTQSLDYLEKQAGQREQRKQKRKKMKVSGKSVIKLAKIIKKRAFDKTAPL